MTTDKARWSKDAEGIWISFRMPDASLEECEKLAISVTGRKELSLKGEKRSTDANAYLWTLVGRIAEKTDTPPISVYKEMIRDLGGNYEVLPIKDGAVDMFREAWQGRGMGWITAVLGESKFCGYTNVIAYYGSSVYDKATFSRLIDRAIFDAKELGIETLTPERLAAMIEKEYAEKENF